ncbi:MAG: chemotaxis protein CheW [Sandaracinaceae bacterium]|nr:chemotaxis protein CheW [Sandaracinaceae bacterium]
MSEALVSRIAELERRVVELRRELSPPAAMLPDRPAHYLEVCVGEVVYLVPVEPIREVLPAMWPAPLPDAPEWVRGTFRYGDVVVPLVDMGVRLHGLRRELALSDVVVLLESPAWMGLLASAVGRVLHVTPDELAPPSPGIPQAPFLCGTRSGEHGEIAHLVAVTLLGREVLLDDDGR